MKKGIKIVLIIVIAGALIGAGSVYYVFNKPHRNVEGEAAAFKMEAKAFFDEFNTDETASNTKYLNKVIQVKGKIVSFTKETGEVSITLNSETEGINCAMDSTGVVENKVEIDKLKVGDDVTLKGKCDGFDMIMGIVLTRCFLVKE